MIKKIIAVATLTAALLLPTSLAKADMIFSQSGVWSQPRIYSGSSVADEPLELDTPYGFKARVENNGPTLDTTYLTGEITGPQNFSFDYGEFSLNPGSTSIRTRTLSQGFSLPGDYTFTTNLDNGNSIERNFEVIPEPSGLALLAVGTVFLKRKRK